MDAERRWVVEKVNQLSGRAQKEISRIEQWLQAGDGVSQQEFMRLFEDSEFVKEYVPHFEALHFAYILARITRQEYSAGSKRKLIESVQSLKQAEQRIKQIKFAIWRLEFGTGEDKDELLRELLMEDAVSIEAISWIIRINAFEKKKVYLLVAGMLLEEAALDGAKKLLCFAAEQFPQDSEFSGLLNLLENKEREDG